MIDSATLTIWGNVVADPRVTGLADNPDRVMFRVISNRRRRDSLTGEWVQAGEFGMNVVCWRKLARGVAQSVHKGDPVLVIGRVSERQYDGSDGQPRWSTELTADFVGQDLSQGVAGRFTRFTQLDRPAGRDAGGGADNAGPGAGGVAGADVAPSEQAPPSGAAQFGRLADVDESDDPTQEELQDLDAGEPAVAVF